MSTSVMETLFERARRTKRRMALPETDDRILQAARKAKDLGIIEPVLLGDPEELRERAAGLGINVDDSEIINYPDEALFQQVAEAYVAVKDDFSVKGIVRKMKDRVSAAMILLVAGRVDCVMAGISHSTAEVVLAGQMFVGTQPGINTISSMGVMDIPGWQGSEGHLLAFSDSAVNAEPDASELADIAITTADTMHRLFDWEPGCCLVVFSNQRQHRSTRADAAFGSLKLLESDGRNSKLTANSSWMPPSFPKLPLARLKSPAMWPGRPILSFIPTFLGRKYRRQTGSDFRQCQCLRPDASWFCQIHR